MITALSLADGSGTDISLYTSGGNILVTDAEGLYGVESPRQVKRPRPTGHGALNDTRWGDGRLISIAWDVGDSTQTLTESAFDTMVAPMIDTWEYGPALLKWTTASGRQLQRLVKLDSDVTPKLVGGDDKRLVFQAQFFAEDPRAYSQSLTTVSSTALSTASGGLVFPMTFPFRFTPSGGGALAATNNGNRKTPPVFRIYGMCVNPQVIVVGSTTQRIAINGSIANGDYLELDVANRTAKLNGTTLQNNLVDSANTNWYELARGTTNLQLTSGTFDGTARLDCLFRSAYA